MTTKQKAIRGRPPLNEPKQSVYIKIDKGLHRQVKVYCANNDKKMAFVVNEALKSFFKNSVQEYIENKMHVYIGDESKQED